jgi:hypothetical protein
MNKFNLQVTESITFPEAITFTQSLLEQIQLGTISPDDLEKAIISLVNSENGARGFFVTYLTTDGSEPDFPTNEVIQALKSAPEIVSELLVKNLAMSTAMAITHRRQNNEEMAQSSEQVRQRTANLINQIKLPIIWEKLTQLSESITTSQGKYGEFLQRWGYDLEQKQMMQQVLSEVIFRGNFFN